MGITGTINPDQKSISMLAFCNDCGKEIGFIHFDNVGSIFLAFICSYIGKKDKYTFDSGENITIYCPKCKDNHNAQSQPD